MTTVSSLSKASTGRGQLRALIALRWRMIRSRHLRWGLALLLATPLVMIAIGINSLRFVTDDQSFNLALATPTLYLGFALLTVIAPLAAGGGYELYPSEQLVAYPVHPRTVFRATLLLAPANLAWVLNVIALIVVTAFAVGPIGPGTWRAIASTVAFIVLTTVSGQALAWWVIGVRQTRRGRWATWSLTAIAVLMLLVITRLGFAFALLDNSPTKYALFNALDGYVGRHGEWIAGIAIMLALAAGSFLLGGRGTAWALRRPGDHANRDSSRPVKRRSSHASVLRELVAIDRASVWRSLPLRRGILVLLFLPGVVAALAAMSWQSLILLPGLVAAGAGLLFGINAFALDSGGSTWLATLPDWPRYAFVAKTWVLTEVTLLAVFAALIGGSIRSPAPNSAAEVTATLAAAIASASIVVASGMRASLRYPYRAELRGSRDTPAPPGVMALHSVRLAVVTTVVSLLFSVAALSQVWWLPLLIAVPVVSWSGMRLIETARAWHHPHVRAFVVTTVSGG